MTRALAAAALAVLAFVAALSFGVFDAGCTGFQWAQWIWPDIAACCSAHDIGGSDGALLDCLVGAGVPAVLTALGVLIMAAIRPIYILSERWRNRGR